MKCSFFFGQRLGSLAMNAAAAGMVEGCALDALDILNFEAYVRGVYVRKICRRGNDTGGTLFQKDTRP